MRRALLAAALVCGCAPSPAPRDPPPQPLPPLPVERMGPGAPAPAPHVEADPGPPVTFTARDADVRLLVPLLAEAAGLSVVLDPAISGRVSVHLRDVPARAALEMVLAQAGLALVGDRPMEAPFGPTVFYPLPVNVDVASAPTIAARYGVSLELARWLVEARLP